MMKMKNLNKTRVRAYAKLLEAEMRTIDEIEQDYRVSVYVELIAQGKITLEEVDSRYIDEVKGAIQ